MPPVPPGIREIDPDAEAARLAEVRKAPSGHECCRCLSDDEFAARVAKALASPAVTIARVNEIRAASGMKPWVLG